MLFGATWCDVDIESKSFILLSLFSAVQGNARLCFKQSNRTKGRKAVRGSIPPPGTNKIKQFLPPVGLRQSGSHPLVGSGYWIAEVEVIRLQPTVRDGTKSVRYRGFMVWRMPWYSAPRESLEILLVGRRIGMMHIVCYLRNKNRGSLNILEDDARG
jgi:hypothetical protein